MKKDCIPKNDKPVVKIGKRKSNLNTQKYNAHNKLDLDFGSILDCLDQGIRIIDKDSYILYINLAFAELSGILPKNAVGHKCWEVFQSPFCHTPNCQLKRILGGEAIVQSEIERIINNGITVPCLVSGFPLRSHDGELVGIMESFLDIRENKKTEKIIDNQNALLKAIINSNPDFLIFSLNANYCYTIFNDNHKNEMRRIWNVDIQEGMNLLDCMTDERTRLLAKESMDRALYGETFTEVQRQEPQDIFYEFNWSPVRRSSGEVIGLTSFVKDVTSLRRAQEQIKESEEQYRALIDLGSKAGEAIVMVQDINGAEGIQTFVSDQWATITGYTRTELLGMSFFDLLIPADQADSVFRHRQKMSGIAVPGLFEMGIICKDKSQKPIELTGAFTTYQGEKANVLYIRDISSRKALERALEDERDKYRTLFDDAPIALWEMDYTLLKKFVDDFRSNGKREIREYFDKNPEDFLSIVRSHKMVRFNKA
jgi:PAS domain S-box-containing protein